MEPGQIGCFMAIQELAKKGERTARLVGSAVVNEFLGVENCVGQLGPSGFIMKDIGRCGEGSNSGGPLLQFLRAWCTCVGSNKHVGHTFLSSCIWFFEKLRSPMLGKRTNKRVIEHHQRLRWNIRYVAFTAWEPQIGQVERR